MNALTEVFIEFVATSWRVAGLILLLAVLRFFVRRYVPANGLFAVWLVLMVALLVPARLPVAWPSFEILKPARPAPLAGGFADVPATAEVRNGVQAASIPAVAGAEERARSRVYFHIFDTGVVMPREWVRNMALMWLAGIVILLGRRLGATVLLQRKLAKTAVAADTILVDAVTRGCLEIGIKNPPVVLITSLVSGPALCGLFRPRVLFPPGFAQRLGADELRFVVLHELGHLRRRDLWAQVLLHVAAAVHWFNPTVWLAVRMARLDCELACDEFVLRRETAETNDGYGRALLKVLSTLRGENRLPATLGIVEGKRQLLTRISMITDYRPQTARRTLAGVVLIAAFAVAGNTKEASRKPEMSPAEIAALPRETRMQMAREKALANAAARERQFYEWTESGKIMLRGIGAPGGVPVAVFDVNGEPKVVVVNSGLIAGTVTAIDGALGRVTVSVGKKGSHEFLLTNPRPVKFPEISPQQFNFIIAPLNKRSAAADAVPNQLVLAWPAINAEGKEAILMNYLRSGWVVDIHVASDGIATTIQRLFAKQISQRNRELRTAFIESLSVEQRDRFSGAVDQAVRIDASPEATANATALAKSNQAKKDRVIEELTSEQRRLYDLWQSAQNL